MTRRPPDATRPGHTPWTAHATEPTTHTFDLVGLTDLPELLGIARQTPRQWRTRGVLPEPQAVVSGSPVWERRTIIDWALETRRIDRARARDLRSAARHGAAPADA